MHRRDVFLTRSERWADPRAKLLQGQAWEAARPSVCRALGRELSAEREIEALSKQLDEAYRRTAAMRPSIEDLRITQINGKDRLALTPLDKLDEPPSHVEAERPSRLVASACRSSGCHSGDSRPRRALPDEFAHISEGRGRVEDLTFEHLRGPRSRGMQHRPGALGAPGNTGPNGGATSLGAAKLHPS